MLNTKLGGTVSCTKGISHLHQGRFTPPTDESGLKNSDLAHCVGEISIIMGLTP